MRYFELNPIRAKMVDDLTAYKWSRGFDRLTQTETIPLDTFDSHLFIDDWQEYLNGESQVNNSLEILD